MHTWLFYSFYFFRLFYKEIHKIAKNWSTYLRVINNKSAITIFDIDLTFFKDAQVNFAYSQRKTGSCVALPKLSKKTSSREMGE